MQMVGSIAKLKPLFDIDVEEIVQLYLRNQIFLRPYEPVRPQEYFTVPGQRVVLDVAKQAWENDVSYAFAVCEPASDRMIGRITLSNVVRGSWQNATIGYFISEDMGGYGYATEAVRLAVDYALGPARLHRIQAAIMPKNVRSARVIEKAGFEYEGLARYYLQIDDVWEDHQIYSVTTERWQTIVRKD